MSEAGIAASDVVGTGKDGRITQADAQAAANAKPASTPAPSAPAPTPTPKVEAPAPPLSIQSPDNGI